MIPLKENTNLVPRPLLAFQCYTRKHWKGGSGLGTRLGVHMCVCKFQGYCPRYFYFGSVHVQKIASCTSYVYRGFVYYASNSWFVQVLLLFWMPPLLGLVWPLVLFSLMRQDALEVKLDWFTVATMELEHTIVLIHEMSVFDVLSVSCMLLVTFILKYRIYLQLSYTCTIRR